MKNILIYLLITFILAFSCKKDNKKIINDTCDIENPINQLSDAKTLILGDWTWILTTYLSRGANHYSETPQSTNKRLLFRFMIDTLIIFQNDTILEKEKYSVGQMRDFTNYQTDTGLIVKYYKDNLQYSFSMLFIDNNCLKLVNSYNDAGGDLVFKRK